MDKMVQEDKEIKIGDAIEIVIFGKQTEVLFNAIILDKKKRKDLVNGKDKLWFVHQGALGAVAIKWRRDCLTRKVMMENYYCILVGDIMGWVSEFNLKNWIKRR